MMILAPITALFTLFYIVCALLLTVYAFGTALLLIAYLRHRHRSSPVAPLDTAHVPYVCIQLPIYNEKFVIERLLDAVARLDYPRDRLSVQVLDDSTDDTVTIAGAKVTSLRRKGLNITHVRRGSRAGFKAGALAYGLTLTTADYAVIFDADFIPTPDFLQRTIPPFQSDSQLAVVQARWGHLNTHESALTLGQTLALDGHFVVEQTGRNRSGFLMNFNGSCGVWRIEAIHDAGGWRDDTLTEDLDLSYRAQLRGWTFLYLPDVVVPGELPPTLSAYKQQQARWSKGGSQSLAILFKPIWVHPSLTLTQRIMAMLHLCQYLVHPLMIALILLTPPLLLIGALEQVQLGILGVISIAPPLIFAISQRALHRDWVRRMMGLPALIILGTGLSWSNARAVMGGLLGIKEEFRRTPKYAEVNAVSTDQRQQVYALRLNKNVYWELAFSLYALWGVIVAVMLAPAYVPYLALYSFSFGVMALWGFSEALAGRRKAHRHNTSRRTTDAVMPEPGAIQTDNVGQPETQAEVLVQPIPQPTLKPERALEKVV